MASAQYRSFSHAPSWTRDGSRDPGNTDTWIAWLIDEGLIHDFQPRPAGTCRKCGSPVAVRHDGSYWPLCYHCRQQADLVDYLVPMSYSIDSGLESLIKHYKDFGKSWTRTPLATLLWEGLDRHGDCVRMAAGPDALYTWVPADDETRSFDHIQDLLTAVEAADSFGWRDGVIQRNRSVPRPGPKQTQQLVNPGAYTVTCDVRDRTVVLLDDLWTSGSSLSSSAAALKRAGARRVIGLVLGRQINRGYDVGRATEIFAEVEARGWSFSECVLCART